MVWPVDAPLFLETSKGTLGPYDPAHGMPPGEGATVIFRGRKANSNIETTDAEKKLLIELGYLQE